MVLSIEGTLTAAFFGFTGAAILYGATCTQVIVYWRNRRDGAAFEGLITFLWLLDTLHFAGITHTTYHYCIQSFGNPIALLYPTWSLKAVVLLSTLLEFSCRSVSIARFWKLSDRNKPLTAILLVLHTFLLGVGLMFSVKVFEVTNFGQLQAIAWMIYLGFGSAFTVDTVITAFISAVLWKNSVGSARASLLLKPLLHYVLLAGVVTSITSLALLIVFTQDPHAFTYIGLYFILCEALFAPLLASLNLRGAFRERTEHTRGRGASSSKPGFLPGRRVLGRVQEPEWEIQEGESQPGRSDAIVVRITQSTLSQVDNLPDDDGKNAYGRERKVGSMAEKIV